MEYLFVLDKNGRRKTSYAVGVHANTMDDLKNKAINEFPGYTYTEGTEDQQQEFLKGKRYLNGTFVNDAQTEEEKAQAARQQLDAEYESTKSQLADSLTTAILRGDTEAQASIQSDYKDLEASYAEAIAE